MKTVTVSNIDGSTFKAPARGKVMVKDFQPSEEQILQLLEHNLKAQEEGVINTNDAELRRDEIEAANQSYYNSLPTVYDLRKNKKLSKSFNITTHNKTQ